MKALNPVQWMIMLFVISGLRGSGQTDMQTMMVSYYQTHPYLPEEDGIKRDGLSKDYDRNFAIWLPRLWPQFSKQSAVDALMQILPPNTSKGMQPQSYSNVVWTPLGPSTPDNTNQKVNGMGQIHRITFAPGYNNTTNKTIYACSAFSGLWKTTDNGDNWTVLNTDLQLPMTCVSDVAVDYNNPDNILISTGYGDGSLELVSNPNWGLINPVNTYGVYRSTDGGQTWHPINAGFLNNFLNGGTTRRIVINPQNSNQVLVATSAGILMTSDALSADPAWIRLSGVFDLSDLDYRGLEFMPGNPSTIYVSGKNIYRSTNGGSTWEVITNSKGLDMNALPFCKVNRINLAVTPADPNRLYAYIEGDYVCKNTGCKAGQIIYIYMFKNETWTKLYMQNSHVIKASGEHVTDGLNQFSPSWMGFAASPVDPGQLFFGYTKVKGCRNTSAAVPEWYEETDYNQYNFHADCHALAFQPNVQTNPKLYAGTHGGVNVKTLLANYSPYNWEEKYNGLNIGMVWAFDISRIAKDIILVGQQCNGTKIRYQDGHNPVWRDVGGGDGYGGRMAYEVDRIMFFKSNNRLQRLNFVSSGQPYATWETQQPNDPVPQSDTMPLSATLPNTFQVHRHPSDLNPVFGFTELYERKRKTPGSSATGLWELESDIYRFEPAAWKRQITEFAIAPSDKKRIYAAVGGQVHQQYGVVPPQFYRSMNGGINGASGTSVFQDLTNYLPVITGNYPVAHPIITGIAVHPSNPDKLWLSFTGYHPNLKVFMSVNGGLSWSNCDPSQSLANLPVNGIVYQEGTNDRLYIATDIGVYVRNTSTGDWERFGNIPNVRVTELKINPCTGKLVAATFGRGVWEADLLPGDQVYQVITASETWANDRILENSICIKAPAKLTVKATVFMPPGGRIIVEPGAELIIDNGKFTQNCGYLWKGIEVWGNALLNQTSPAQGKVFLSNKGSIENAEIGILAGKRLPDNINLDPAFGGGIVYCRDATFSNNVIALRFTPYPYNTSHLENCLFLTDRVLNGSAKPDCFIRADQVRSLKFSGCSFRNTLPDNSVPVSERGMGIRAFNSTIILREGCKPGIVPCYPVNGVFEMLTTAIEGLNCAGSAYIQIRKTSFIRNLRGIYLSGYTGISSPSATECDFNVFLPGEEVMDTYGLCLNQCSGYKIEDNRFFSDGSPFDGIGMVINNSVVNNPAELNLVYRNSYSRLLYGVLAMNRNRHPVTGQGLCFKCNTFNDNLYDIFVSRDPSLPVTDSTGIAANQGSGILAASAPAGNRFDSSPVPQHLDIHNGGKPIRYYYHHTSMNPALLQPQHLYGSVTLTAVTVTFSERNSCPNTSPGTIPVEEMEEEGIAVPDLQAKGGDLPMKQSVYEQESSRRALRLMHYYRSETYKGRRFEKMDALLQSVSTPASLLDRATLRVDAGKPVEAQALLVVDSMPGSAKPVEGMFPDYIKIVKILDATIHSREKVLEINREQSQTLEKIAARRNDLIGTYARNLLVAAGLRSDKEPLVWPEKK